MREVEKDQHLESLKLGGSDGSVQKEGARRQGRFWKCTANNLTAVEVLPFLVRTAGGDCLDSHRSDRKSLRKTFCSLFQSRRVATLSQSMRELLAVFSNLRIFRWKVRKETDELSGIDAKSQQDHMAGTSSPVAVRQFGGRQTAKPIFMLTAMATSSSSLCSSLSCSPCWTPTLRSSI